MKELYIQTYKELANHYIAKKDALEFLEKYAIKEEYYLPKDKKIREFVEFYYKRYLEIEQETF